MSDRTCTLEDCDRKHEARGLCKMHWKQQHGKPNKQIEVPCATCGKVTMKATDARLAARFCSWLCRDLWNLDHCRPRTPRTPTRCAVPADHPARWFGTATAVAYSECAECGAVMVCRPGRKYCDKRCRLRKVERVKRHSKLNRHRARRVAIFERDNWVCWLCGGTTSPAYAAGDLLSPTVDHLIPRSLGGTDDDDNLGTAHMICNSTRGNSDDLAQPPADYAA